MLVGVALVAAVPLVAQLRTQRSASPAIDEVRVVRGKPAPTIAPAAAPVAVVPAPASAQGSAGAATPRAPPGRLATPDDMPPIIRTDNNEGFVIPEAEMEEFRRNAIQVRAGV